MKISRILVENFLGVRALDIDLRKPILLVAGANGAGKSSVQEAVRLALTGETVRVSQKQEYPLMVSDGGHTGAVGVWVDGERGGTLALPGGKWAASLGEIDHMALRCSLDAQRFASLPLDQRRTFLFDLTGLRPDGKAVRERLERRGAAPARVEMVMPMLRNGFPAASDFAADKAKDAKGAWRGITSETYGSKKGGTWSCAVPAPPEASLETAQNALNEVNDLLATCKAELSTLTSQRTQRATLQQKAGQLREACADLKKLPKNLEIAEKDLAEFEPKVVEMRARAAGKKREGLVHDLARGLAYLLDFVELEAETKEDAAARAALAAYEAEFGRVAEEPKPDPDAVTSLPKHEEGLKVLQNRVANLKRDLATAQTAKAQLDAIELPDEVTDEQVAGVTKAEAEMKGKQETARTLVNTVEGAQRAIDAAKDKTTKAAAHHADVEAWTAIAESLAPDGIPGEMLAEALAPLNNELAAIGVATDWAPARIDAGMTITAGSRPYTLLSESEKWRTDAMIAAAITRLSGLKLLVLDRMDVLDLAGRSQCLGWLNDMAETGEIDTALVFATLKAIPAHLPEAFQPVWLESGHIQTLKEAA